MLGVHLAPDGSQHKQIEIMRRKLFQRGEYIRDRALRDFEKWTALNTTIMKSLEYPLVATTLSRKNVTFIMAPAITAGLQSSGFGKSFPREILYAPPSTQGMGVTNLFHKQYIRHIKDIIDQTWRQSPSEKFILMIVEAFKLEAGLEGYVFQSETKVVWLNTPRLWIADTLSYCQEYGIRFREPGQTLGRKRIKDIVLMSAILLFPFSKEVLQAVNRC